MRLQDLEGWVPPYDATVVDRLRQAGLPILGKTNMDEFAMGSSTEHSAYGPTHNPRDLDRIPAAPEVARPPPSPRSRRRSRSAPTPAARSASPARHRHGGRQADLRRGVALRARRAGQLARPGRPGDPTVLDSALLHEVIGGHDPLDSTSFDQPLPSLVEAARQGATGDMSGVRIASKELTGEGYQDGVQARFDESVHLLEEAGAEVVEVSRPTFVHALAAYYLILPAEASSNLAKFDAMRYGLRVHPRASRRRAPRR